MHTTLPGMKSASAIVHVGPRLGASFTEYVADLGAGGELGSTPAQRFFFVIEGAITLEGEGKRAELGPRSYAYAPQGIGHSVKAATRTRIVVIEKPYEPLESVEPPRLLIISEEAASSCSSMELPDIQSKLLLPDLPTFDFAVQTVLYQPGTAMSASETEMVEQGLIMLEGRGIYRLSDSWYSVAAGDFIWMRPLCPHWFGVIGKVPAEYLVYKSSNR
jgi:(S)-ureidoglycine aminohydrolase